ncbi:MAG: hypothetical protein FJW38_12650 [Acidobacteria bacterium]|nr:hypothetical protein [Acidobacteriota bacterium]
MLLLIVPAGAVTLLLALIGVWFYFTNSKFALAALCLPLLLIPVLFVQNQLGDYVNREEDAGNTDFKEPGKKRLANAIAAGDVAAVRAALPAAGDLKTPGERGLPILIFALLTPPGGKKPNPEIIAALLKVGADPNAGSPDGTLPLERTFEFEIVKLLVEHGADPNKKGHGGHVWFNVFGEFYGGVYRGADMFDLYLAHGLKLEGVNNRGRGPLAAAAEAGDWRSLRIMLERGLNPNGVMIHTTPLRERLSLAFTIDSSNAELRTVIKLVDAASAK